MARCCSSGPARPSPRPKPPLSTGSTLPSPSLLPRQFPLLAQSYLEERQEHNCAQTERDQRDGEHFAGQPTDQGGADRTSDNERRGRSECKDARAGRHRPKVSLRLAVEQLPVAGNVCAAPGEARLGSGSRSLGPASSQPRLEGPRLPNELVDDPCDVGAGDRTYAQLPPPAIGMLRQPRPDAGILEQAADDRCAAVAFASRPAHIDAEAAVIQGPDRQPVRTGRSEIRRDIWVVGTRARMLK
jgi:hypothetical protein